jgi:hypothetical protein
MASFQINQPPSLFSSPAAFFGVFRFSPNKVDQSERYQYLPNVRFVGESTREGPEPGSARFRYEFGTLMNRLKDPDNPLKGWLFPTATEDVFPLDAAGQFVVSQDDRLVVRRYFDGAGPNDEVTWEVVADGYVQAPQADIGGEEAVTFETMGVPYRLSDVPIAETYVREAHLPTAGDVYAVSYPAPRFNPDGLPNATPDGYDVSEGNDDAHPVFLDVRVDKGDRSVWTVSKAVRYLIRRHGGGGGDAVNMPTAAQVNGLLTSWEPSSDPEGSMDPNDPDSWVPVPIPVPDLDVTGKTFPEALWEVISPHGFTFSFRLTTDPDSGDPVWDLIFRRRDTTYPVKDLLLQKVPAGGTDVLDTSRTNVFALSLSRDGNIVNEFEALSDATEYECSLILVPLFALDPGDMDTPEKFEQGTETFDPVKYRCFGVDEIGDGHWDYYASPAAISYKYFDFNPLFAPGSKGKYKQGETDASPVWVPRPRPVKGTLLSKDDLKANRPCELYVSTDYTGDEPGVWDGTGTWQKVQTSVWNPMKDRLGVRFTGKTITDVNIGFVEHPPAPPTVLPFPGGTMNVLRCLAAAGSQPDAKLFSLRFVCRVSSDAGLGAVARRRDASPTTFPVRRVDELRDRFVLQKVHKSSPYAEDDPDSEDGGKLTKALRDDTKSALAHAEARRRAHEMLSVHGQASCDYFTSAYEIGDRVRSVRGRGISLRQNAAAGTGEGPVYPTVVGRTRTAEPRQTTTLELNDNRPEPAAERRS